MNDICSRSLTKEELENTRDSKRFTSSIFLIFTPNRLCTNEPLPQNVQSSKYKYIPLNQLAIKQLWDIFHYHPAAYPKIILSYHPKTFA